MGFCFVVLLGVLLGGVLHSAGVPIWTVIIAGMIFVSIIQALSTGIRNCGFSLLG